MTKLMRLLAVAACLLGLVAPAAAQDQTPNAPDSFALLQKHLNRDTFIYVVDHEGHETRGIFRRLTHTSLVMFAGGTEHQIQLSEISRVEKKDPAWTGPLIGGAIGGVLGSGFIGGFTCPMAGPPGNRAPAAHCGADRATWAILLGGLGVGIGALGDQLVVVRRLLYSAPSSSSQLIAPSANQPDSTGAAFGALPEVPDRRPEMTFPAGSVYSFGNVPMRVKKGDSVQVTDVAGHRVTGKLENVSASSIVVLVDGRPLDIPDADVRRVVRSRDSLWNGFAIGATFGAVGGGMSCSGVAGRLGCGTAAGLAYGAIGAGIDALIGGSKIAYIAPSEPRTTAASRLKFAVSGVVTPERKAVGVALRF
jgi:hypothetical protein